MTLEQRLDHVEQQNERILQQNQRIKRKNKRLTAALTLMVVAMCAVVTLAAAELKDGYFDTVVVRKIWVVNGAGEIVVSLGANDGGDGLVQTKSAQGKELVTLSSTVDDEGTVTTFQTNGKQLVRLGATENGGLIDVTNKTGEDIAQMYADEYGNGVVGAWNRKGRGRTLTPGP